MHRGKFDLNDELELWDKITHGHQPAKMLLFKKYRHSVLELALTFIHSEVAVLNKYDLYAIGLEKLWNIIDDFDPRKGNKFWTFARMRIWGTMKSELRNRKNIDRRTLPAMVELFTELHRQRSAESKLAYKEKVFMVDYLLQHLTCKERIIAEHYFMLEKKNREVCAMLKCSSGSLRTQAYNLRKKLRLLVQQFTDGVNGGFICMG